MMEVQRLLDDVERHGARAWRFGDRIRLVPAGQVPDELRAELAQHRAELLRLLPEAPPDVAALQADPMPPADAPDGWIISSASAGGMRLVVGSPPETWPPGVYRAAALVEVLDERHRADRADAQAIADELEALLAELRSAGVEAWLTS